MYEVTQFVLSKDVFDWIVSREEKIYNTSELKPFLEKAIGASFPEVSQIDLLSFEASPCIAFARDDKTGFISHGLYYHTTLVFKTSGKLLTSGKTSPRSNFIYAIAAFSARMKMINYGNKTLKQDKRILFKVRIGE